MNQIEIFEKEEFGSIRMVNVGGIPYFVGKDVAEILGYSNSRKAIGDHVDEEDKTDGVTIRDSIGREQNPVLINESGLYSLILSSRLPSAKRFKRWVTSEVLPVIRKHGVYALDELLADPDTLIAALTELKAERERARALEQTVAVQHQQITEMKPKEEFFDAVADSKDAIEIGKVAKVLNRPGIGRNKLFEILRRNGILMKDNTPYQKYIDNGCFRTIEQKYCMPDGETRISIKTLVYQKGVDYIRKILEAA